MATIEQMAESILNLGELCRQSRLLPHGIVASRLCVSKQRLDDLIRDGVVRTEKVCGARLVLVRSALIFAKARYQRISEKTARRLR